MSRLLSAVLYKNGTRVWNQSDSRITDLPLFLESYLPEQGGKLSTESKNDILHGKTGTLDLGNGFFIDISVYK